jgi:hypothetical protein
MSKDINDLVPDYTESMDIRGNPTRVCPCSSDTWNVKVKFDEDGDIGMYFLDMECASCGTLATAPTPIDGEIEDDDLRM